MHKGTPSPYALRPAFVASLKLQARRLGNASKALARRQWLTAKLLLEEWNLGGYEGEITKDEYYTEASRCICDELGFAFVSLSGETVKVWCEVFQQFENTPESLKANLPFAYFRNARFLANAGKVAIPMAAIAVALDHRLTAREMLRWYNDPPVIDAAVLEIRKAYPDYLWNAAEKLLAMNGNRQQAAYHLNEFVRLYEAEKE